MTKSDDLIVLWRSIVRLFPAWSLGFDFIFSPATYRLLGTDLTAPSIARDRRVRNIAGLLDNASADICARLVQLARINADRTEAFFKASAVTYVSLPIALAALISDVAPSEVHDLLNDWLPYIAIVLFGLIVGPLYYFAGMWRAKQILWAIELHAAGAVDPLAPPR
jgi:hypothetical protein